MSAPLRNPRLRQSAAATFRSLKVRNYRLFFWGQSVSLTGTWMQAVAQTWLVVRLTGSGLALGTTVALQFLPVLLFGLWGGALADRFDKRRLLIATQVVPALLAGVMGVVVATGVVHLWMVWVLAFLLGCVHMVDMPARHAFVSELVGSDDTPNAVALNSAVFNTGRLVGPAAAGVLIASVGIAPAFFVNAVSYLAALAALAAMRTDELRREPAGEVRAGRIRAGLRYVWSTADLRRTIVLVAVVGTFGVNFGVVLPLLARYSLGGGAALYGLLTSLLALGSLAGSLFAASRTRAGVLALLAPAGCFGGLLLIAAGVSSWGTVGVAIVLVPTGGALMLFLATANATLQRASVPAMRGRVMALYGMAFLGSTPLGGPLLGWISGSWGARVGLAFSGGMSLLAAGAAFAVARRRGRRRGPSETQSGPATATP